jgi:hypothetical protein
MNEMMDVQNGKTKENKARRVIPTNNPFHSLKINNYLFAVLGLVLLLGTCQTAKALDFWSTSGKVTASGEAVTLTGSDPNEIKGWVTIKQIMVAYKVSWEEFSLKFNIPTGTNQDTALKDLENVVPGFSLTAVRAWLQEAKARTH